MTILTRLEQWQEEQLKLLNPHVRVLLSSGYDELEAVQRFTDTGLADGFISKPYTAAALARKVKEVLGGSSLGQTAA